tara:strand:+ start:1350 stop:1862 length:513 start_codon:yes stop_codon:yes gene_type:complete
MGLVERVKQELKERSKKLRTFMPDCVGGLAVSHLEVTRVSLMYPNSKNPHRHPFSDPNLPATLDRSNTLEPIYTLLEHVGDWWEGYIGPLVVYYGMGLLFPNSSEKTKVGVGLGLTQAFIVTVESGVFRERLPDIPDTVGGLFGSLLFLGAHYAARRIVYNPNKPSYDQK